MNSLKITLATLLIGFSLASHSQKIELGLEVGSNIIPLNINNNDLGQTYGLGIHSGLRSQYHFSEHFSLTTGLSISQKKKYHEYESTSSVLETLESVFGFFSGGAIDLDSITDALGVNTDVNRKTSAIITMNNLELPLLATYRIKNFRIYLGGYGGILLSASRKQKTETTIPFLQAIDLGALDSTGFVSLLLPDEEKVEHEVNNNTNDLNEIDFGAIVGIGYQSNHWNFNLLYSRGFAHYRLINNNVTDPHIAFRFTLGYQISFRKEEGKIIIE